MTQPASIAFNAGTVFQSRYKILEKVGEGGFGCVYRAQQLSTSQVVAVKVIAPSRVDTEGNLGRQIPRFEREMQLCARLHHPNIVQLIDSGLTDDGQLFAIFEYVPGKDMAETLATEGAFEPREAKHLMVQVLDGLACAHALGVVHRDLKPHNIMLTTTGARRNAVILDFGISGFIESVASEEESRVHLTGSHELLGTPAYAAPEQLRGERPTPRADIYAWGLVLLECLTGRRVVTGSTAADMVYRQLSPEPIPIPAPLSEHPIGQLIKRAVSKNPKERPGSAHDLLRELEECVVEGPKRPSNPMSAPAPPSSIRPASRRGDETVDSSTTGSPLRGREIAWDSDPGSQRITALMEARTQEGGRRQITAVCCELLVSGAAADDPEALSDLSAALEEACATVAARFGGYVGGGIGDRILLYFGYPRMLEDDPQRAARAALALVEAFKKRREKDAKRGLSTSVRVGLDTGIVLVRDAEPASRKAGHDVVVGAPVNIAGQISALAQPGAVLVSEASHRLLRGRFSLERAGAHPLGKSGAPMKLFALGDESAALPPVTRTEAETVQMVGRAQEMALLQERWQKASAGSGQSILITGEPGIGKSRLAREMARRMVGQAFTILECRCDPESKNSSLRPIIELLERLAGFERTWKPEDKARALEELVKRYGFTPAEAMPIFTALLSVPLGDKYAPLDVSPERQKELTLNALASLLVEIASTQPLLFVMEDLHWADPTTLSLLTTLVDEASGMAICVVLTARSEFVPPWPAGATLQIQLSRVEGRDVEALVAGVLGGRKLSQAAIEYIAGRTDGVPLFIEELTQMLLEAGLLAEQNGVFELKSASSAVVIPATLRGLLMARLDRLDRSKDVAQLASVLGREFDEELLRAVSPFSESTVKEGLDQLVGAGLLLRKRRIKGGVYTFKHALIQDVAYESLASATCREYHARAARALEDKFPGVVEQRPELMARHFAAADQKAKAIQFAQLAAGRALQSCANAEAAEYARQATGWVEALADERERAETELGLNHLLTPALMALQGIGSEEVAAAVKRSEELLDALGETPHAFSTLFMLQLYHFMRANYDQARGFIERAIAIAERESNTAQQSIALSQLGQCYFSLARFKDAEQVLERAISLYNVDANRPYTHAMGFDASVMAQNMLGLLFWLVGYPDRALAIEAASVTSARELNHGNSIGFALVYLGGVHHYRREREQTVRVVEELAGVASRYGLSQCSALGSVLSGWAKGEVDVSRQVLAGFHAFGQVCALPYWNSIVAESEAAVGQLDAALERLDACLTMAAQTGEACYLPELHRLRGTCLRARSAGPTDEVEGCFRRAIDLAREYGALSLELRAAVDLGRLLRDRGLAAEARAELSAVYGRFTEGFDTPDLTEARALLNELGT